MSRKEKVPIPEAVFVATILSDETRSMGCLVEDGTFLTTLHSIYDIENNGGYFDLSKMRILFVKENTVYYYNIKSIIHDGSDVLTKYGMSAITFDYALLELDGDPVKELGGGLQLDKTNHFGSAFASDPQETMAVSGPLLNRDKEGGLYASRHVSVVKNYAASSGHYTFPQMGIHTTQAGMSGQAIFSNNILVGGKRPLYAVHRGHESNLGMSSGFKVSEYLARLPALEQFGTVNTALPMLFSVPGFIPEANRNRTKRLSIMQKGKALAGAVERTEIRLKKYDENQYTIADVRELAKHFPQLGMSIFSTKSISNTLTNKIIFMNRLTGWYVCYDKHGQYSTVHNAEGDYVALDGTTSRDGKEAKYHFNNISPDQKVRNKA